MPDYKVLSTTGNLDSKTALVKFNTPLHDLTYTYLESVADLLGVDNLLVSIELKSQTLLHFTKTDNVDSIKKSGILLKDTNVHSDLGNGGLLCRQK